MAKSDWTSSSSRDPFMSLLDSQVQTLCQAETQNTKAAEGLRSLTFCDILTRTTTAFVQSQQKIEEASKVTIHSLPTELRTMIMEVEGLTAEDKFCFKLASKSFAGLGLSFEQLSQSLSVDQRYELAIRLRRRAQDTYLCSGCKRSHPHDLFEDQEKWKDDSNRLCIG